MNDFLSTASAAYPIIGAALNVLLGVGLIWLRAHFTPRTETEALAGRVARVEKSLAALATAGDVKEITRSLNDLKMGVAVLQSDLKGYQALFERLEGQVGRIDEFLTRSGK